MLLTCPCCAARFSIEATLMDEAARRSVATALALPSGLGEALLRYVSLFRPAKRSLSWDRAAKLLEELLAYIRAGHIERHRVRYSLTEAIWAEALAQLLGRREKLNLPLTTHGYLMEILIDLASRAQERKEASSRPLHASHLPAGVTRGVRSMSDIVEAEMREKWDHDLGIGVKKGGADE